MVSLGEAAVIAITIKAIDEFSDTFSKTEDTLSKVGKGFLAFGAVAATALTAVGIASVNAAMEAEAAQNRLSQILKTSRGATDEQVQALFRQAEALEKVGVVSSNNILITQSQLATFDLEASSIEALTPAILNYVVAEKGANASTADFKQMTNGLAQALQGNFASLTRTGFVLDDATKAMIETGTEEERIAALTKVLDSTYAGFNETAKDTAAGGMQALKNEIGGIMEKIGTTLLPLVKELTKAISDILPSIIPLIPPFTELVTNILGALIPLLPRLSEMIVQIIDMFINLFGALITIIPVLFDLLMVVTDILLNAITPIIPAIGYLVEGLAPFLAALIPILEVLNPIFRVIGFIIAVIMKLITLALKPFTKLLEYTQPLLQFFENWINLIAGAFEILGDMVDRVLSLFGKKGKGGASVSVIDETGGTNGGGGNNGGSDISDIISINDAIIRPNGQIIETNPNDTLIATQNPGGITIHIHNVNGLSGRDIARELQRELEYVIK